MTTVYSDQQRAEALARVLSGETVSGVARAMGIERTNIQKWLQRKREAVNAVVTVENKPTLVTLIGDYLDCNLRTMAAQAARMGERAWLEAQTTSDLIAAHNELGKRAVSILDRIHRAVPINEPADSDS